MKGPDNSEDYQIKLARKYLKMKILEDNLTFRGHEQQRAHVFDLLSRTLEAGESNSALIIGPRGSGKTTLVNSVLRELNQRPDLEADSIVVRLSGLLHTDDKLALKAITSQMSLENAIGDRVFGSFAENLAFLLSCLRSGADRRCRSVLFFLEEFHVFCRAHGSQTLLYNLFDIAQSRQAPICVIGITCRLDVIELLEKRVKSRFSHRQIFIFPNESPEHGPSPFETRMNLFRCLLSLPSEISKPKKHSKDSETSNDEDDDENHSKNKSVNTLRLEDSLSEFLVLKNDAKQKGVKTNGNDLRKNSTDSLNVVNAGKDPDDSEGEAAGDGFGIPHEVLAGCNTSWKDFRELDPIFVSFWNENIEGVSKDFGVRDVLEKMYEIDVSEQVFRNLLFQLVCKLSGRHPQLEAADVVATCSAQLHFDEKVCLLTSLSILELSLLIAMKHQTDIFDGQPMNFQMVLSRYTKFANCNSSSQSVPRAVILKAFEHLISLELVLPCGSGLRQKEYQLHRLAITPSQISEAVRLYRALPTEIIQWAASSLV